jgi:hypothetical protein
LNFPAQDHEDIENVRFFARSNNLVPDLETIAAELHLPSLASPPLHSASLVQARNQGEASCTEGSRFGLLFEISSAKS